jgi:hypothetical protein
MSNIENAVAQTATAEAKAAETGIISLIRAHPKTVMSIVAALALIAILAIVL